MLVDKLVVKLQHGRVKLRHDHVFVIAFIADQRSLRTWINWIIEARQIPRRARLGVFEQRASKSKLVANVH